MAASAAALAVAGAEVWPAAEERPRQRTPDHQAHRASCSRCREQHDVAPSSPKRCAFCTHELIHSEDIYS
eukprot:scaffold1504_cov111-Isochrysis_galbana.AAC.7